MELLGTQRLLLCSLVPADQFWSMARGWGPCPELPSSPGKTGPLSAEPPVGESLLSVTSTLGLWPCEHMSRFLLSLQQR